MDILNFFTFISSEDAVHVAYL